MKHNEIEMYSRFKPCLGVLQTEYGYAYFYNIKGYEKVTQFPDVSIN